MSIYGNNHLLLTLEVSNASSIGRLDYSGGYESALAENPYYTYGTSGWADVYNDAEDGALLITGVQGLYDPHITYYHIWTYKPRFSSPRLYDPHTGVLEGVVASDVKLSFLNQEVKEGTHVITSGDLSNGPAMGAIVEDNGFVVAAYNMHNSEYSSNKGHQRLFATRSNSSELVKYFEHLNGVSSNFTTFKKYQTVHQDHLVIADDIGAFFGFMWTAVYIIPRGVLYENLDRNTQITFCMLVFMFTILMYLANTFTPEREDEWKEDSNWGDTSLPIHPIPMECDLEETLELALHQVESWACQLHPEGRKTVSIERLDQGLTYNADLLVLNGVQAMHGVESWQYSLCQSCFTEAATFNKSNFYKKAMTLFLLAQGALTFVVRDDRNMRSLDVLDFFFASAFSFDLVLAGYFQSISAAHLRTLFRFPKTTRRDFLMRIRIMMITSLWACWVARVAGGYDCVIFIRPMLIFTASDRAIKAFEIFIRTCYSARIVFLLLGGIYLAGSLSGMLLLKDVYQPYDGVSMASFMDSVSAASFVLS